MTKITLKNNYHGSEVKLNVNPETNGAVFLTQSQIVRARRTLCGYKYCTCAENDIGMRGPQDWEVVNVSYEPHRNWKIESAILERD